MRYWRLPHGGYVRTKSDMSHIPGMVEVTKAEADKFFKECGLAT